MDPVPSAPTIPPTQTMPPQNPQFGSTQTSTPPVVSKKSYGPVVGAIIIVALLVFGALYFWGESINKNQATDLPLIMGNDPMNPTVTQIVPKTNNDSIDKIQADLDAASTDSMNASVDASLTETEKNI